MTARTTLSILLVWGLLDVLEHALAFNPPLLSVSSSSSHYAIIPRRDQGLMTYEEEEDISFDGKNLNDIIALALAKAQGDDDDDGGDNANNGDGTAINNICEGPLFEETENLFLQVLNWQYTIEYFPQSNVDQIIETFEVVLQKRLAPMILECQNAELTAQNIVGETADPPDSENEGACTPDFDDHVCKGYEGAMNLFLADASSSVAAVTLARDKIQEIFADTSFVVEIGGGLTSVKFGFVASVADLEDQGNPTGRANTENDGGTDYVVTVAFGGGFLFFAALLFAWRRQCYKNDTDGDGDDGGTILAPTMTIDTNMDDGYSTEEPIETPFPVSPFSESPFSNAQPSPFYFRDHSALSDILEVTNSYSTETDDSRIGKSNSQDSAVSFSSQNSYSHDVESNGMHNLIGLYGATPSPACQSSTNPTVLGIMRRYKRNDFISEQMQDAATITNDQQLSTIEDSNYDDSSTINSSTYYGDDAGADDDVENLLNRTRESENDHDDDLLFVPL